MKNLQLFVLLVIASILMSGCSPGSSVQVSTPATSMQLTAPGPNPLLNQPDVSGRIARAGTGLWHGIIAPATLLVSFFSPNIRMYEVHNAGSEYDIGFLLGLSLVFSFLGFLIRLRR